MCGAGGQHSEGVQCCLQCLCACLEQLAALARALACDAAVPFARPRRHGPSACPPTPLSLRRAAPQVCEDCPNVQLVREPEALTVSVEPGMPDGHTITFFEEGEPIVDGEKRGNSSLDCRCVHWLRCFRRCGQAAAVAHQDGANLPSIPLPPLPLLLKLQASTATCTSCCAPSGTPCSSAAATACCAT